MNVFDLSGPEFLLFYLILFIFAVGAFLFIRNRLESEPAIRIKDPMDPYAIAGLRRGPRETARIAFGSLLDRGIIIKRPDEKYEYVPELGEHVHGQIEKEICQYFKTPRGIKSLGHQEISSKLKNLTDGILSSAGVLPGARDAARRVTLLIMFVGGLESILVIKLLVAISRHKSNIFGLVAFIIATPIIYFLLHRKRLTARGSRFLADLNRMAQCTPEPRPRAADEKPAAISHAYDPDLVMTSALWGPIFFSNISEDMQKDLAQIRPLPPAADAGSASLPASHSSCGSSCGSSGGGGCGSSGCGGCGSN